MRCLEIKRLGRIETVIWKTERRGKARAKFLGQQRQEYSYKVRLVRLWWSCSVGLKGHIGFGVGTHDFSDAEGLT